MLSLIKFIFKIMFHNILTTVLVLLFLNFLFGFLNGFIRTMKTYKERTAYFDKALDELEKQGEIID